MARALRLRSPRTSLRLVRSPAPYFENDSSPAAISVLACWRLMGFWPFSPGLELPCARNGYMETASSQHSLGDMIRTFFSPQPKAEARAAGMKLPAWLQGLARAIAYCVLSTTPACMVDPQTITYIIGMQMTASFCCRRMTSAGDTRVYARCMKQSSCTGQQILIDGDGLTYSRAVPKRGTWCRQGAACLASGTCWGPPRFDSPGADLCAARSAPRQPFRGPGGWGSHAPAL